MHVVLEKVLSDVQIDQIKAVLADQLFVDGRVTSVLASKKNLQVPLDSEAGRVAGAIVLAGLQAHALFNQGVLPAVVHPPLFSRYEAGMEYPDHVDVALMGGMRADVALTLFLSDHDCYEGGALVVDTANGVRRYRLPAGDAIAYPANTFHHVARVTSGARLAAVLWIQSSVRDPAKRQLLLDLKGISHELQNTVCGPRLLKSYWNLLRLWAEPGRVRP